MKQFNEKLKEIGILELIGVCFLSLIIVIILEIDIQWFCLFPILYAIYRTRNELSGLKSCANNLFSTVSPKTWLLLIVTNYIFALGSGLILKEMFPSFFFILGSMSIASSLTYIGADFLFSVILGPICEELIFRGIIFNRLNKKLPILAAIIISSIIFCSLHPYSAQLSGLIFGITMCIAYLLSDNILVPISLHMSNNLISMAVPYIPNIASVVSSQSGIIVVGILTLISLVYIMIFIVQGYREIKSTT